MTPLLRTVRALLARRRFERDMREELAAHIEHRADDLAARGIQREDARRQARVEFGALEAYKEQCRDASGFFALRPLHGVGGDLKLAARRLAAAPLFTLFAVLSIAVGVGVTTAAYAVVDAIFWKESGIPNPHDAVVLGTRNVVGADTRWTMSKPDLEDLARAQQSFAAMTASFVITPAIETPAVTEIRSAEGVEATYFDVLGVVPPLGRFLNAEDVRPGAPAVVVLSHDVWRRRFAGDPGILGQAIRLDGHPFQVIGIAPHGFGGLAPAFEGTALWISLPEAERLRFGNRPLTSDPRDRRQLSVFARLKPGVTVDVASAEVAAIGSTLDIRHPLKTATASGKPMRRWMARSVHEVNQFPDSGRRLGALLIGLVALVLVVACTNLANLVLARGTARIQEVAVRRALGASRWRLVREQVAESAIIGLLGGMMAVPALLLMQSALNVEIPIARYAIVSIRPELSLDLAAVAAAALLVALLVFGLEPALSLTRKADVRQELASAAGSVGVPKVTRQRALLRWQVAVSSGFFIIAALTVRYLVTEARHDSGVDLDRIAVAEASFRPQQWEQRRVRTTVDRIMAAVAREPGVESVAVGSGLPFGTTITPVARLSHAFDSGAGTEPLRTTAISVSQDFFRTMGIALTRGRPFDNRDQTGAQPVIVLSESTARQLFGTIEVVGRELSVQMDPASRGYGENPPPKLATIAGVAEDTDTTHFLIGSTSPTIYLPFAQEYASTLAFVARADRPSVALGALRTAARIAAPEVGFERSGTGYTLLAGPHVFLRTLGMVAVVLGIVTLLLAMVGLFGVQSHVMSSRTREIGVRMSLGATSGQIRRLMLKDGYRPVLQGLAMGLFIGIVGRALIQSQTPVPIGIVDRWMLLLVPVPLLLAAFFACWLPAYRASRVDPNVALRHL
ncbi:MAG TPA: ABC transporter permease [Vicinamibacterales bacterium]